MNQLLKDPNVTPTEELLAKELGKNYDNFQQYLTTIAKMDITLAWRYYHDGKAWLGKGVAGKKTVFWLSLWEGLFKVSFFFTDKTKGGISSLQVTETIKAKMQSGVATGKLIPLIFDINEHEQLDDLLKVTDYKRKLK